MEYAIIKDSGVQFQVKVGDRLEVDHTEGEPATTKTFGEVLLISRDGQVQVGQPTVAGATVKATLIEQFKGPKGYSFKIFEMNRKAVKKGFRAQKTAFKVEKICATADEASQWDASQAKK